MKCDSGKSLSGDHSAPSIAGSEPLAQRPETIQRMFSTIAPRYDLANSVLSLGIHHLWRRSLIAKSGVAPGSRVLDAATGTGDLALGFAKRVGPSGEVVGGDFALPMLDKARLKQGKEYPWLRFEFADVTNLPFESNYFDVVSISFGIRNVSDPERGLAELTRVLKPTGKLLVLEFGTGAPGVWGSLFRWYSSNVLPVLGGLVTGEAKAYKYLEQSSAKFPSRSAFVDLMQRSAPLTNVQFKSLTGGIAFLYWAQKHDSAAPRP